MPTDPTEGVDVIPTDPTPADKLTSDQYAWAWLRAKNIKEYKSILTYPGMLVWPNGTAVESGTTIMLLNKGIFTGKWIIQFVKHVLSGNRLTTEIELRKCLKWGRDANGKLIIINDDGTTTPVVLPPVSTEEE